MDTPPPKLDQNARAELITMINELSDLAAKLYVYHNCNHCIGAKWGG
jgi:hypothetical protein